MRLNNHAGKAVEFDNSGSQETSSVDFNLNLGENEVGIVMNFKPDDQNYRCRWHCS
jgi:hypothetical protein